MQQRNLLCLVLAIPMAGAGICLAADEMSGQQPMQGIVLKDQKAATGTVRMSKLIGAPVADQGGEEVGKVSDIVVEPKRDQVSYLVLSMSKGMIGLREKLVALPYQAIKFGSPAETRVYVTVNKDVLDKAPGFDDSKWPSQANADYYRSLDNYYKTQLSGAMQGQAPTTQPSEAQPAAAQMEEGTDWFRRASKLEGRGVTSRTGENLGRIEDLVLDQKTNKVLYAALEYDGKLHAVPISAFTADPKDQKLILDTSKDQLKQAPSFDEDHWPSQADPRWSKQRTGQQQPMPAAQ